MSDRIHCLGYGRQMTRQDCVANRVSLFCLPGWPCETCEAAVVPETENRKPKTRKKWPKHLENASAAVRRAWMEG